MEEMTYSEPDHPGLAATYHNLAGVYEAQGRLNEAAEGFERSMLMYETYYFEEPNRAELATTIHNLRCVKHR